MRAICYCALLTLLCGCTNQVLTRFYTLSTDFEQGSTTTLPEGVSLGIGPVTLPSMLDRSGIVSQENGGPQIIVAGLDLWAGDLDVLISRTVAELMSQYLNISEVWLLPWDTALRPEYQLRVFVDKFSGELGGPVTLKMKWVLLAEQGTRPVGTHVFEKTQPAMADGYVGYVQTLSQLLADFAAEAARVTAHTIKGTEIYPAEAEDETS